MKNNEKAGKTCSRGHQKQEMSTHAPEAGCLAGWPVAGGATLWRKQEKQEAICR